MLGHAVATATWYHPWKIAGHRAQVFCLFRDGDARDRRADGLLHHLEQLTQHAEGRGIPNLSDPAPARGYVVSIRITVLWTTRVSNRDVFSSLVGNFRIPLCRIIRSGIHCPFEDKLSLWWH